MAVTSTSGTSSDGSTLDAFVSDSLPLMETTKIGIS